VSRAHASTTGDAFYKWLYVVFDDVSLSLSEKIQTKTDGVEMDDLVGLLRKIKLAIYHFEQMDPDDLEFGACTIAGAGENDLMTYLAKLTQYKNRLKAVDQPMKYSRAQRVLLKGLNLNIFGPAIAMIERYPYPTYDLLQKAIEAAAAKPRVLDQLRALKPNNPQAQSVFATGTPEQVSYAGPTVHHAARGPRAFSDAAARLQDPRRREGAKARAALSCTRQ
jgi:hypothetical protein